MRFLHSVINEIKKPLTHIFNLSVEHGVFPEKFKEMSPYYEKGKHNIDHHKTVRACPGITDYMSMGFVIPAFCDIEITPTPDGKFVETRYSEPTYNDAFHPEEQLGNFLSEKFPVRALLDLFCKFYHYKLHTHLLKRQKKIQEKKHIHISKIRLDH